MENERYDIAIIGTGAAGLSAALNAKIRNKRFIIFGSKDFSEKLEKAHEINNYLGFPGISGSKLKEEFRNHMDSMEIEINEEKVTNIYAMGDYYSLLVGEKIYESTTVILATGVNFGKPLTGELEFLGKGVGYCATCDAPLYRDKTVTIVSYTKKEESEANFVAEIASKVNYIPMYKEEVELKESVEVIRDIPVEIKGSMKAEKLVLKNREIDSDGIFILRESVSPGQLVPGLQMDGNHIGVNRKMETNLPGCFAAGDIVGTPYQYIKAAGEGNIAALSAVAYVDEKKKESI